MMYRVSSPAPSPLTDDARCYSRNFTTVGYSLPSHYIGMLQVSLIHQRNWNVQFYLLCIIIHSLSVRDFDYWLVIYPEQIYFYCNKSYLTFTINSKYHQSPQMSAFIHLHVSQGYTRVFIQKQSISRFKSQILDISIYIRIGMKQFLLLLSCQDNAESGRLSFFFVVQKIGTL